jgi:hypothetical protein
MGCALWLFLILLCFLAYGFGKYKGSAGGAVVNKWTQG